MAHTIGGECNGCTACAGQCPVEAIAGRADALHTIGAEACIDCGVCGLICPVEAVRDGEGRVVLHVPRDRRPRPVVDLELCNGCGHCVDHCPFQARAIVGRQYYGGAYVLEPHRCVGCGECSHICIKVAITPRVIDVRGYDPADEAARILARGLGEEER